jgi:hypothetical protein
MPQLRKKPRARRPARIASAARMAPDIGEPATRPLKAYAFDPSQGTLLGNQMTLSVRYEELDPGPVVRDYAAWDGVAVIDYDATNDVYYLPVNLDDPKILIRGGLDPIEADPRFHQQMVYAVVTETIQHFEAALGRRIHWRRVTRTPGQEREGVDGNIYTLNLFPHALVSANAFYSPQAHGILFGYFRASDQDPGRNLPGQVVYTCLSHDIVVHETTHAMIDGIKRYFTERTNPDVAAFHEAFADLAALFRHFTHSEALLDTIQRTGGMLYQLQLTPDAPTAPGQDTVITAQLGKPNPLVELARQFGEATGLGRGLRGCLGTRPNSKDIETVFEPHARGAILVAAVFDAYFSIYARRTADLFRIYRSGGGQSTTDLPGPLARMLADEAARTAEIFFTVCVRSLDYCPPVDITFGDFLRAMVTADFDLHPVDDLGLRDALMQAFRLRGIVPDGSAFFSDTAIAWPPAVGLPPIEGLEFPDPNGFATPTLQEACKAVLRPYVDANRRALGFVETLPVHIMSFHPVFRVGQDGALRTELVVEAIQEQAEPFEPGQPNLGSFPMRGGATIIVSRPSPAECRREYWEHGKYAPSGRVRYVIGKQLHGEVGEARKQRQRRHYERLGLVEGSDPDRFSIDFALTHGGF